MERYPRLRDLREDADLTQAQVGQALHLTQRAYAYYESGQRMLPPQVLCALARYYGVSVDYLLGETDVRALSGGEKAVRDRSAPPETAGFSRQWQPAPPRKKTAAPVGAAAVFSFAGYGRRLSPSMHAASSSIRSSGKGGAHSGLSAMLMSFMGLSSAATRLALSAPQRRQRWMSAHSPFLRTQTATGSMTPPQSAARSPGVMSTCRLHRQFGQWLRWLLPAPSGFTSRPQALQEKLSRQGWVL